MIVEGFAKPFMKDIELVELTAHLCLGLGVRLQNFGLGGGVQSGPVVDRPVQLGVFLWGVRPFFFEGNLLSGTVFFGPDGDPAHPVVLHVPQSYVGFNKFEIAGR